MAPFLRLPGLSSVARWRHSRVFRVCLLSHNGTVLASSENVASPFLLVHIRVARPLSISFRWMMRHSVTHVSPCLWHLRVPVSLSVSLFVLSRASMSRWPLSVTISFSLSHAYSGYDVVRLRVARYPKVCLFRHEMTKGWHLYQIIYICIITLVNSNSKVVKSGVMGTLFGSDSSSSSNFSIYFLKIDCICLQLFLWYLCNRIA